MATSASNRGIRHVALTGRPGWYHFRYRLFYQTCMSHSTAVNTEQKADYIVFVHVCPFRWVWVFFCRNVSLLFILFIRAGT